MKPILISGAQINGITQDLLIKGNRIERIAPFIPQKEGYDVLEGANRVVVPGMANTHTHAAMTLFRGYGDDLPLMPWLEDYIWPVEAHLTDEDIYWGVRLACLEMIRTGTTVFLDMYASPLATAQAVEDSGIRAVVGCTLFDRGDETRAKIDRENCYKYLKDFEQFSDRVIYSVAPHAIYTVSGEQLQFCRKFADETGVFVHLHLSETQKEVEDAIKQYGLRPAHYLEKIGAISDRFILAHSLWLEDDELDIIAKSGAATVHNPASNMKLASGYSFRFEEMKKRGIPIGIGTDGCSSSNNLDMFIAMRLAALLGKVWRYDPTATSAKDIYQAATEAGYNILGLEGGVLKEGALADLCLLKTKIPTMVPMHNLVSNLVYSADGSVVDTTIVNGCILMREGTIPGEEEVIMKAAQRAYNLIANYGIKQK
ncbi:amidohydrolase [Porphyromonas circumdentaria]|uniref:5-methylthioadenosine/S-adenosylhomocysteine deaminase n=1 Tax=Porphyromonas circumdentaria TaxID=29524 RepID=A0A1T4LE08_9PORP|nr:amidohydrolase [Porphyromonas circumdentaria]MBB6275292.1 5-methylthioadenosine/S-adenosylhomocysteine deaminase [Porphyromonas circumdentaria]MDO4722029.1 amidohydrolase [Porphyromonas circumdentaria]SJZ52975.1 5-methylthioadenosine/S-adenosylhomocysteine deaminase [Porphyromonas circumdentaria]